MHHTPPYLTPAQLSIEPWEHQALVALVPKLQAGTLRLDMQVCTSNDECDTAHCIGGWVAASQPSNEPWNKRLSSITRYVKSRNGALNELYYPGNGDPSHPGWRSTPQQAAQATLNFLTLGHANWDQVMAQPPSSSQPSVESSP